MRESLIERHLVQQCKLHDFLCWKFTSPGLRGVPDRIVVHRSGKVYFVELKSATGTLSRAQRVRAKELKKYKQRVHALSSLSDVNVFMHRLLFLLYNP